jgi:carboxyl-terminal processing protease
VVIVGAGQFRDEAIDPRPTADADAKALYDVLTDRARLDVPAARVRLLLSAPDEKRRAPVATREAITKAVEDATAATGKDDLLILAFFGRGATIKNDKTVFLTPDTTFAQRDKTALAFGTDLAPAFKNVSGQKVLLLMDVHYKGFKPGAEVVAEPALTDVDALLFGSEDREDSVRPLDRLMLLSGFIGSDPLADGDNGLFARALIDALKGAADKAPFNDGYEPDGLVTTDELVRYLDKVIPDRARAIGKTDKEKEDQAVPIGRKTSHFVTTRNPAEAAKARKRLDALAALAAAGTVNPELEREGAALLARMPKLKAAQELRKRYQELADGTLKVDAFGAARKALEAGRKLDPADAEAYAAKVTAAVEVVTKEYINQLDAGTLVAAAIRGMYRRSDEPLPTELADALKNPKGLSEEKRTELLKDARVRLGRREDLDENKDVDLSILMMLSSLNDPYTVYYDKETVRRMASALKGRFPGAGVQVRRDAARDGLLIVTPIKGGPAFDAGIRAGDLIVEIRREVDAVTGNPLPDDAQKVFSTKGMKIDEAIALITGKPGSPVTLVVSRDGKELTFALKRNWVNVETVMGVQRNARADWDYRIDEKHGIGYVRVTQFTQSTVTDLRLALDALKKKGGLNGLILDLRGNPGGYLTAGLAVSEIFVGKETLVTVKPREGGAGGRPRVYRGEKPGDKSFEIVVLVNGTSASASEIVAACLQDHGRATIVGERSFGKGSVQNVFAFAETGGELKMTIARYYPPLERNIDKFATKGYPEDEWGVRPDKGFEVPLTKAERDAWELRARELETIPAPGKPAPRVTEDNDKQLKVALTHLRETLGKNKKGPDGNADGKPAPVPGS